VTFNAWTFLFEILNFLVLAFVLHRLLYRPLRAAIDARKAANEKARTDAEVARKEADETRQQLSAKLADVDRERTDVLRKAAEQAEAEKAKRLAEADATAKGLREQAQRDANQLRQDTMTAVEAEVGTLAVDFAERLLRQAGNTSLNDQLIQHLAELLRGLPTEECEAVRRDAGTGGAVVESAGPIDGTTRETLISAIRELLGRACEVTFEVKPALVSGALVRIAGRVWDASVAAQLDAARAAIRGKHDGKPG
jgi:F-type H+-transporting ATPase subunit b